MLSIIIADDNDLFGQKENPNWTRRSKNNDMCPKQKDNDVTKLANFSSSNKQ
jgi:hypothetical protein